MRVRAANVGFLFREVPYLERFRAAREAGFEAVEFAWPVVPDDDVVAAVRMAGLRVVLINMNAGDLEAGERGHTNDPRAVDRWRADFVAALRLADTLGCPTINILAGNRLDEVALPEQLSCLRANLDWAVPRATAAGRTLTIEMLNPADTPRYMFVRPDRLAALLLEYDDPALRFQFDTYHVGRVLGASSVPSAFRGLAGLIGHLQIADVPGRHEPGSGEIDWAAVADAVTGSGYGGAVGLEYEPTSSTADGLQALELTLRPGHASARIADT